MPDAQHAVELPLVSLRRERRRWLQKIPHAVPAAMLLSAGVNRLRNGDQGFALALALGEFVVSALLLRMLVKEAAASRQPHTARHKRIEWFEILAAGVLTAEALD